MAMATVRSATRRIANDMVLAGLGVAAMLPLAAYAELSNDSMVGLGVRTRPAYDGSRSQHEEIVPVVRYLGRPWFLRSTQGVLEAGARFEPVVGLNAGVQLAYEPGRQAGESAFLRDHQVADIARGVSVGLQLEWDHSFGPMPVTLLVRTRQHTTRDQGAQADLRLSAGLFQGGAFGAGVFVQSTWADAKSARAHYGIDAQRSAVTGLPTFQPGAGLLFTSAGLLWSLGLGGQWVVVGNLEARRLRGDAAQSPLVERRSGTYASAGLAYRF
jgi:outer membrane scaffolding protein for murein synthesis (MipA/OmpV family)